MAKQDFKGFFLALDESDRARFAKAAGTTVGYLMAHVIHARKRPKQDLFMGLVKACRLHDGPPEEQMLKFFYSGNASAVREPKRASA